MKTTLCSLWLFAWVCAVVVLPTSLAAAQKFVPVPKSEKKYKPYTITRGDTISVSILGEQDLNAGQKRVEATGTISMPLIQEVRVYGMTIAEAQELISKAYRDGRFLRNPIVTVTVEGYASRTVKVNGKVNQPGTQQISPDEEVTILDVISKAGGLGDTARGKEVRVTRTMPDGTMKVITLDVESALRGRVRSDSVDASFIVEPDDIIYVPEKII